MERSSPSPSALDKRACASRPVPFADRYAKQFAMRELMKSRALRAKGLTALAVGLGFGVMGPFGTSQALGTGGRYVFWLIAISLNWLQIASMNELIRRAAFARDWSPLRRGLTAALALSLPATLEVSWLELYFFGARIDSLPALAENYFYVLLVSIMLTVPNALIAARQVTPTPLPVPTAVPLPARSPFLDRIRPDLGTDLLALEMEDHYLRVHTAAGSDLILCRFGDALKELQRFDGLQIHRSWWIARSAIATTERDGQKMSVTLTNGLVAPVSRTFQKALA